MARSFSLRAVISAVDRITGPLAAMNRAIGQHKKAWADVGSATGNVASSAAHAVTGPLAKLAGTIGLAGGGFGVAKVIEASAEFEKLTAVLETIEGSAEKAKAGMAWVSDFAAKTPYQLKEVTDSFVKLKAYGIDPQKGALRSAGDAAAALGKPLEQAVEALADALTGENERLKEFGIKAEAAGNQIVYRWSENGKDMVATANKTNKAQIQAVVTGIWNRRYQGAMDKLSQTWSGMWSNLQDAATRFLVSVGDAGFFDAIKAELKGVLDLIEQWGQDGTLKTIAAEISTTLVNALKGAKESLAAINWRAVAADVKVFWSKVQEVVVAVGGWGNAMIGLFAIMNAGTIVALVQLTGAVSRLILGMLSAASAALSFGLRMAAGWLLALGPIGLIIAGITALVAAGWFLVSNWDQVKAWAIGLWDSIKSIWQGGVDFIVALINGDIAGVITGLLTMGKGVVAGLKIVFAPLVALVDKVATLAGIKLPKGPEAEAVSQAAATASGVVAPSAVAAMAASPANQNAPAAINSASGAAGSGGVTSSSPALSASLARVEVVGNLLVTFKDAPPGMRVDGGGTNHPGLAFASDVGYRNQALGVR